MKDGEGIVWFFVILAFGVFILAAWMLYKIAEGIYHRPQIILVLALLITAPIWLLPVVTAWIRIVMCRNWMVYLWHLPPKLDEKFFIVLWLTALPVAFVVDWLGAGYLLWSSASLMSNLPVIETLFRIYPAWPDVFLAYMVVSMPMLVGTYYYLYFRRPPKHPNWAFFIAAEEQMIFDTRLTLLRLKTGLRLIAGR